MHLFDVLVYGTKYSKTIFLVNTVHNTDLDSLLLPVLSTANLRALVEDNKQQSPSYS